MTTTFSRSSSSAYHHDPPPSPVPPSSASAGAASSPTPNSSAASARSTATRNPRSSASSSTTSAVLSSRPRWTRPTVFPPLASPRRCPSMSTGDRRRVALPPDLFGDDNTKIVRNGALLCDDGYSGCRRTKPFKVVLLRTDDWLDQNQQAFASLYDSKTGVWSDLVSTSIKGLLSLMQPGILVGNSFYWLLDDREEGGILVFDLNSQSLATIMYPAAPCVTKRSVFQILRMEDGGLGLAVSSIGIIQLWERKTSSVGIVAWRLQKTIDLDKLLLLKSPMESSFSVILGYDEDGHVMFIMTDDGIFMVQLKSMKFRKIFNRSNFMIITAYHPYRSFYAIGSGEGEAETLSIT